MNAFQQSRWRTLLACAFLVLATLVVYWPARHYKFVAYDDNDYVYENPMVRSGLTWQGLQWSYVDRQANNWHPLTWLSHMADCQIFGLNAGGPHMVNVAFHCANTVLLFLLLQTLMRRSAEISSSPSGFFWRNLFVAALFALHPLRVESVAWISERKDVLSGFFGLLTLLCYAKYARGTGRPELSLSYRFSVVFFACSLLAKPMLVTLPLVMLLLDYWPLQRCLVAPKPPPDSKEEKTCPFKQLIVEKWQFFLLAAIFCLITLLAQNPGLPAQNVGLFRHIQDIAMNYFDYVEKLLWPQNLSFLYLRPTEIPISQFLLAVIVLFGISVFAVAMHRRCPALLMGWLWFLIVLLPVCGLVSLGRLSIADRYTYLPSIGFYIMMTWGLADFTSKLLPFWTRKIVLGSCALFLLADCAVLSRQQLTYWQNTWTLYDHALKVDPDNYVAKQNLHIYLFEKAHPDVRTPPPE